MSSRHRSFVRPPIASINFSGVVSRRWLAAHTNANAMSKVGACATRSSTVSSIRVRGGRRLGCTDSSNRCERWMTIPATAYPPPVRNGEVYRGDWLVEQSEQLRCRVMAQRSLGADPQPGRPQDGLPRGYSGERCVDPLVKRLPATASQPAIDRGRRHSRVKCLLPREHSGLSVDELPASGSQMVGHPATLPKPDPD